MLTRTIKFLSVAGLQVIFLLNTNTATAQERNSDWKIIPASYSQNSSSADKPFIFNTNQNKVKIIWSGREDGSVSHYIIEHSKDGKNFRQLALFFTEDNSDIKEYEYNFAVPIGNSDWKIIPASYSQNSSSADKPFIFNTNQNKVKIIWSGREDGSVSHYIIEHSKDGKNFRQLALFFTEDNSDIKEYEYNFAV